MGGLDADPGAGAENFLPVYPVSAEGKGKRICQSYRIRKDIGCEQKNKAVKMRDPDEAVRSEDSQPLTC